MKSGMEIKRPIEASKYNLRMKRIEAHFKSNSPMMKIPPIAVSEMKMAISAFYGGRWRALYWWTREELFLLRCDITARIIIGFCDLMGWTKLYDLPGSTKEMPVKMRHGRKCFGSPNCENMNCIEDSLPRWFKQLTKSFWTK